MCLCFPLFLLLLFLCIYYTFLFKTVKDTSVCDCVSELWVIYRFFFSPLVSLIYIIYLILSHFPLLFLT